MQETPVAPELLGREDDDDEDEELDEMQVFSSFVQNLDEKKLSKLFVNVRYLYIRNFIINFNGTRD